MFFRKRRTPDTPPAPSPATPDIVSDVIPLAEEETVIGTREVAGDTVTVQTLTDITEETVELALRREDYRVERRPMGTVVTDIPEIRRENGVTIIPVCEERLVVVKQIVLREEIHLIAEHDVQTRTETVPLRRQRAVVSREAAD